MRLRFNTRHFVIAVMFLFAQICASATIYDHLGDPLHAHDDCAVCTTIGTDNDDLPPPAATSYVAPSAAPDHARPTHTADIPTRPAKTTRARAPPSV